MNRQDFERRTPRAPRERAAAVPARAFRANAALAATFASLVTLSLLVLFSILALSLTGCAPDGDGGEVRVSGILTGESTRCQALTSEDGERYALTGDLGEVQTGDLVDVTGTLGDEDDCDGGIVVNVTSLQVVAGPNSGEQVGDVDDGMKGMDEEPTGEGRGSTATGATSGEPILLEGELTDLPDGADAGCQGFRGDDGVQYALTGDLGDFVAGDAVRVLGTPAESSTCGTDQTTIEIVEISELAGAEDPAV